MRNRNHHIQVWLNDEEFNTLNEQVRSCGLRRETYLRQLIQGYAPQEMPPPDYAGFMQDLRRVGHNLNQIARKAHAFNSLDVQRYDENCRKLDQLILDITEAVIIPRKRQ